MRTQWTQLIFFSWFSKYGAKQIEYLEACFQVYKGQLLVSAPYDVSDNYDKCNFLY